MPDAPRDYRVIYVDINACFASLEQQDRPELRGHPVAVVSHRHPRGSVLAASYEAKACGVSTGCRVAAAQTLCPGLVLREARPQRYRQAHAALMAGLRARCGPEVVPCSIDEAAIYLAPNWQNPETAARLARAVKGMVAESLGETVRCSVGIGPNRSLAKLGTDLRKPDGLVTITLASTRPTLAGLVLTDLCGIGQRLARRLADAGIPDPLAFYDAPADRLRHRFGIWGQYWWWRLHGYECESGPRPLRSMSHEHVLTRWTCSRTELEPLLATMAERLAARLHRNRLQCQGIWLRTSHAGAPPRLHCQRFDAPLGDYAAVCRALRSLADALPDRGGHPVRKLSLGLAGLVPAVLGRQESLAFPDMEAPRPSASLADAVAAIRGRFGPEALLPGSALAARTAAQEPVGFGRVRDRDGDGDGRP